MVAKTIGRDMQLTQVAYQVLRAMGPAERIRFYYKNSERARDTYNPVRDITGAIVSLQWKKYHNLPLVMDIHLDQFAVACGVKK